MNADVTLACEPGVMLQTVIYKALYGIDRFFLKEIKNVMFLNKIDVPLILPCCILCCLPASQAVLKRFRRVSAILVSYCLFKNITFFISFKKNRSIPYKPL